MSLIYPEFRQKECVSLCRRKHIRRINMVKCLVVNPSNEFTLFLQLKLFQIFLVNEVNNTGFIQ